jgi:hypothetical protein
MERVLERNLHSFGFIRRRYESISSWVQVFSLPPPPPPQKKKIVYQGMKHGSGILKIVLSELVKYFKNFFMTLLDMFYSQWHHLAKKDLWNKVYMNE